MINTDMNMIASQLQCKLLVFVTFYSLNEHSSKREPNENTYNAAYHNTAES